MSKCPYCKKDLIIEDFFEVTAKETKKGKVKTRIKGSKGENYEIGWKGSKMWASPARDTIMRFSEYRYSSAT